MRANDSRGGRLPPPLVAIVAVAAICIPVWIGSGSSHEGPDLGDLMKTIGRADRKLRRQVGDAGQRDDSLTLVRSMQQASAVSLGARPSMTDGLPPGKQAAFVLAFKRKQVELIGALLDLEEALLAGDFKRAKVTHKRLGAIKKAAHAKFQEKEDS